MNITVFGTGYVGLVQGAVLAYQGHQVLCIDLNSSKIERLKQGIIPIYEPGLAELVDNAQKNNMLTFSTDSQQGVRFGDIVFIAVGTPPNEDGSADLKYVMQVAETIAHEMMEYKIIVNKSTVPVGTADKVRLKIEQILRARSLDISFDVVSNPEFLKEGSAVDDCLHPDRIIIGTGSRQAQVIMRELYSSFDSFKIIVMDERSAELTKYAANSLLATKISFINEISNLSEYFGADIELIRKGIASDSRIGPHFISPGLGYGGSCFPKDVQALISMSDKIGFDAKILKAVEARNFEQKNILFKKIDKHFDKNLTLKIIAIWGLAFKPNTDDIREAASRVLIDALLDKGAIIRVYDPKAMDEMMHIYKENPSVIFVNNKEAAISDADALAIVTEWDEFRSVDFSTIKRLLKNPVIFDGRNIYDSVVLEDAGFSYYSIGRSQERSLENKNEVTVHV